MMTPKKFIIRNPQLSIIELIQSYSDYVIKEKLEEAFMAGCESRNEEYVTETNGESYYRWIKSLLTNKED